MAFSTGTTFEIRSTGNDLNSGGFNAAGGSPGTDRTQQDAAQVDIDGVTIIATVHTTTTQLTLVGYTVSAADNRNTIRIKAGGTSAVTGVYEITAVDVPNNRWTMSSSMGTAAQTVRALMGGAWASLTNIQNSGGLLPSSPVVWIKNSATYSINGLGVLATSIALYGYGTTRGDGIRATINIAGNRTTGWFNSATIWNLILDLAGFNQTTTVPCILTLNAYRVSIINAGSGTNVQLFSLGGIYSCVIRCFVEKTTNSGISNEVQGKVINCVASACGIGFDSGSAGGRGSFIGCIAISCTTAGFRSAGSFGECYDFNCTAYDCAKGFVGNNFGLYNQCLAVNSTTYGFDTSTTSYLINCAAYNSGTANVNGTPFQNLNFVTLSSAPFTNAAGGDFSINSSAGGGSLLKGLTNGAFPGLPSTAYTFHIGAVEPLTGGSSLNGIVGGILGS